jgi:transcriptional regulator with XRE-family HTH domain
MSKSIVGKIIGGVLKEIRGSKIQKTFAKELGLNQSQYNLYETGRRLPSDEVLKRVAQLAPNFREVLFKLTIKGFLGLLPLDQVGFTEEEIVEKYLGQISADILITEEEAAFIAILREVDPGKHLLTDFIETCNSSLEDLDPKDQQRVLNDWNTLRRYLGLSEYKVRVLKKVS